MRSSLLTACWVPRAIALSLFCTASLAVGAAWCASRASDGQDGSPVRVFPTEPHAECIERVRLCEVESRYSHDDGS